MRNVVLLAASLLAAAAMPAVAQVGSTGAATSRPPIAGTMTPPPDYVIGADDVLRVVFWRDDTMSSDVTVRPDGRITLPLINDIVAVGLTPEALRAVITEAAEKYVEDPSVTVVVKEIRSRKIYIMGQVNKPGPYDLGGPTTVLQLIATAGGLQEYAKAKEILVTRTEKGKPLSFKFNYADITKGKNLAQNIELKPGDIVIVP